jgi:Ca2+-binding EF-hand superfamily protein
MRRFILMLIVLVAGNSVRAQDVVKCDERVIRHDKTGSLTASEISLFLMTLGEECRDTEFSETSNEFLFALLDKQLALTLNTIQKIQSKLEKAYILDMLTNPINDLIDIKALITKIENTNAGGAVREEILKSLREAQAK